MGAEPLSSSVDCPELFALTQSGICYPHILTGLEQRYADTTEPLRLCGLSLGGMLALDYAIRHREAELQIVPGAGHEVNKCAPAVIVEPLNR